MTSTCQRLRVDQLLERTWASSDDQARDAAAALGGCAEAARIIGDDQEASTARFGSRDISSARADSRAPNLAGARLRPDHSTARMLVARRIARKPLLESSSRSPAVPRPPTRGGRCEARSCMARPHTNNSPRRRHRKLADRRPRETLVADEEKRVPTSPDLSTAHSDSKRRCRSLGYSPREQ